MRIQHQPFEQLWDLVYNRLAYASTVEELCADLGGVTPSDDPEALVDSLLGGAGHEIGWLSGGFYYRPEFLLANRIFSHRVTAEELEAGELVLSIGAEAVVCNALVDPWLDHDPLVEAPVGLEWSDRDRRAVSALPGWLSDCVAGELCGWRIRPVQELDTAGQAFAAVAESASPTAPGSAPTMGLEFLPRVDEPPAEVSTSQAEALAEAYQRSQPGAASRPGDLRLLLAEMVFHSPNKLDNSSDVILPLEELLEQAGLALGPQGESVAPVSYDWEAALADRPVLQVVSDFRLDPSEAKELRAAAELFEQWLALVGEGSVADADAAAEVLASSGVSGGVISSSVVAEAFGALAMSKIVPLGARWDDLSVAEKRSDELLAVWPETARCHEEVDRFAVAMVEALSGKGRLQGWAEVPWLCLQAVAAGVGGDAERQLRLLESGRELDREDPVVEEELGYCRVDQSLYEQAHELLSAAGARGMIAMMVSELTRYARSGAGRNEPCPCGSGDKFKRCHGSGKGWVSQADATATLYQKAVRTLHVNPGRPAWSSWPLLWKEQAADEGWFDHEPPAPWVWFSAMDELDGYGVVTDILLAEGGGLGRYVKNRAGLLPDDEVAVAERWCEVGRAVFRVAEADLETGALGLERLSGASEPGSDTGSGTELVDCAGDMALVDLKVGRFIVARPLPVGGGRHRLYGGFIEVDEEAAGELADLLANPKRTAADTAGALTRVVMAKRALSEEAEGDAMACFATVVPADEEKRREWEATVHFEEVPEAGALQIGVFGEEETMVVALDEVVCLVSFSADQHRVIVDRLPELFGSYVLVDELGISAAVLREEAAFLGRDLGEDGAELVDQKSGFDGVIVTRLMETAIGLCFQAGR